MVRVCRQAPTTFLSHWTSPMAPLLLLRDSMAMSGGPSSFSLWQKLFRNWNWIQMSYSEPNFTSCRKVFTSQDVLVNTGIKCSLNSPQLIMSSFHNQILPEGNNGAGLEVGLRREAPHHRQRRARPQHGLWCRSGGQEPGSQEPLLLVLQVITVNTWFHGWWKKAFLLNTLHTVRGFSKMYLWNSFGYFWAFTAKSFIPLTSQILFATMMVSFFWHSCLILLHPDPVL